jgi:hypothetical protein
MDRFSRVPINGDSLLKMQPSEQKRKAARAAAVEKLKLFPEKILPDNQGKVKKNDGR